MCRHVHVRGSMTRKSTPVLRHVCRLARVYTCVDMCIDMRTDMCTEVCVDMCLDMCTHMCTHTSVCITYTSVAMCVDKYEAA